MVKSGSPACSFSSVLKTMHLLIFVLSGKPLTVVLVKYVSAPFFFNCLNLFFLNCLRLFKVQELSHLYFLDAFALTITFKFQVAISLL